MIQKARGRAFLSALPLFVNPRFQVLFHSPSGVLFTFPSRYLSTIGHNQYLALPDGAGRFRQDFSGPVLLRGSPRRIALTSTGLSPSVGRLSSPLRLRLSWVMGALQPPTAVAVGFGLAPVRSPLLGGLLNCFLFLRVLRCFSSPGWLPRKNIPSKRDGFPHSDTCGSGLLCSSPQLFAALHVLHRLVMPRHPPYALACFHLYDLHHRRWGKPQ